MFGRLLNAVVANPSDITATCIHNVVKQFEFGVAAIERVSSIWFDDAFHHGTLIVCTASDCIRMQPQFVVESTTVISKIDLAIVRMFESLRRTRLEPPPVPMRL